MRLGGVNISLFWLSHCFYFLSSDKQTNTMYVSLSTRFNVISKIIRTKQTYNTNSTIKNICVVDFFFKC